MSYQVLARRWRPQKFEDVVGQGHIVRSLQNSLKEDRVGHAYIFSGTRGIGKTSIARIFAKALRCETRLESGDACGSCRSCEDFNTSSSMNVIEIDGASNNGVDDIRDLIGNIQYLPSSGKYKVYIIDEVHMLSTPAFNALLKTLEEPPEHAIFLMATTEPEKLLGTVLSRCQRFDFRHAGVKDLADHIRKVSVKEGIEFEQEILITELAKLGNGSFRDALSLLDQVLSFSTDKNISEEVFSRSLGVAKTSAIKNIIEGVIEADVQRITETYRTMIAENVSLKNIVKSLLESVFGIISSKDFNDYNRVSDRISKEVFDKASRAELYWIYEVLAQDFAWSLTSIAPEDATEIVIRKVALRNDFIAEVSGGQQTSSGKPQASSSELEQVIEEVVEEKPVVQVLEQPIEPVIEAVKEAKEVEEIVEKTVEAPRKIVIPIPEKVEETVSAEAENKVEEKEVIDNSDKSWEGFLNYLTGVSPASSSNLEQGNLTRPLAYVEGTVAVSLGFPQSSKVFFDYLNEAEAYEKLKTNIAKYFDVELEKVSLILNLVNKAEAEKTSFQSKFEIKVKEEEIVNQNKEKEIASDEMIKHAEDIFGSSIDKIVLNEKNRS